MTVEHEQEPVQPEEGQEENEDPIDDPVVEDPSPDGDPPEAAEFSPNPTYRILEEEHQMPERIQGLIKSKEDEDFFRDLFERAHGLDHVKNDRTELRSEVEQLRGSTQELQSRVSQYDDHHEKLNNFASQGDWASVFELSGIPPQAILMQAKQILELSENPQQQAQYQQQRQQFWQSQQARQEVSSYQQGLADVRQREVDMVMRYNPVASQAAQEFDQQYGQGSFKNEVIRRGQTIWQTEGRDIGAEESVNDLLKLMGRLPNTQSAPNLPAQQTPGQFTPSPGNQGTPQQQAPSPVASQVASQPGAQARPPVLPNIEGGSGGAPVRRPVVKSMDDIHRIREERRMAR